MTLADYLILTNSVRAYLAAARHAHYLLADVITELNKRFDMTPQQIGAALAQDLKEQS